MRIKVIEREGKIYGIVNIGGVDITIEPKDNDPKNIQPALVYFLSNQ